MGKFYSDELEKGIELLYFQHDTSKYEEAIKLIQQACDNQEPDAYYIMARCYAWGDGNVKGNEANAIAYSQKGIQLGSDLCVLGADRFDELAKMQPYMTHSLEDSFHAVKEMAEAGNPVAQYAVALFYYWGDAIEIQEWDSHSDLEKLEKKNGRESIKWYKMAAEQGHISAFKNLYISTHEGSNGVPHKPELAFSYAESFKDKVQIPPELCYSISCDYEDDYEPEKSIEWMKIGISKGGGSCMNALGLAYLDGEGVEKDFEKAFELFQQGHEAGEPYATYNLGKCYHNGWACTQNQEKAFEYFLLAANQDVPPAQASVAQYFDEGLGGAPIDMSQCKQWAEKAAGQGNSLGKYYLGKCYLYGQGAPINYPLAFRLLQECLEGIKHADAYMCLGEMYENGWLVSVDYNLAAKNYQLAAKYGSPHAWEELSRFKQGIFGKWKLVKPKKSI